MKKTLFVLVIITSGACVVHGQALTDNSTGLSSAGATGLSSADAAQLSDKTIRGLQKKYTAMTETVDRQSVKMLNSMEKQESGLQTKLAAKDSAAGAEARKMLTDAQAGFGSLKARLTSPLDDPAANRLKQYIPGLDSLQSALRYISQGNLPPGKLQQIQALSSQLQQLQGRLQQANEVQSFVSQQAQQWQAQAGKYGTGGQLLTMNKTVYYYQQQLTEYKGMLNDKSKLEQTVLSRVSQLPAFKSFIQKNGMLAQLFPTPDNFGTPVTIAGLQTSAQVQTMIAERTGGKSGSPGGKSGSPGGTSPPAGSGPAAGMDPQQFIDQQVQAAQSEIDKLKNRLRQLGNPTGNTNMTMPDFTPNNQKTKTFWKRLVYGLNIQNTPSSNLLPVTSEIAGTVGYKLSDNATAGLGVSYNLGWGTGLDHIRFSSQGIGLRSYLDIRAKGSIWITGGYEYNYLQQFAGLADLRNYDIWQKSALLGLTKKYNLGKMGGNLQLLYDFLAASQVPQASPLKFRIGYTF